ncbi:MAG: class I SAM-dependent methyltransferase [Actinomycetota bacterium]|nr:class I SAM-dependent methyltransferase [Actinomycetota bacterium]
MPPPLLLHSLAEFRELIFDCLELVDPSAIVEIGSEHGTFTVELLRWAKDHGATVHAIDPAPTNELNELAERWPELDLVEEHSPQALQQVEPGDVYLIDGDHNYITVLGELEAIHGRCSGRPYLAFLHDVGWPCGRRDQYYQPEALSAEAVHPHTYGEGVVPDSDEVVEGGFRGEGQFAFARHEGGPANGVLTAVEDFLAQHDEELAFARVPCVFGLGVLYPKSAPWADSLATILAPYGDNDLLGRLEENRLTLYLSVLELQDDRERVRRGFEQSQLEVRDLGAENRALWARTSELEDQVQHMSEQVRELRLHLRTLKDEVDALVRSRAFAVAEGLSRVRSLAGATPGLSRQRLREVLGGTAES